MTFFCTKNSTQAWNKGVFIQFSSLDDFYVKACSGGQVERYSFHILRLYAPKKRLVESYKTFCFFGRMSVFVGTKYA